MKKKLILYMLTMILLLNLVFGTNQNVTEFDDGSQNVTVTSATTKTSTLVKDSTVKQSNFTIIPYKYHSYKGSFLFNVSNLWGISLIPGTDIFYVTDRTTKIYKVNSTGEIISNVTITSSCNFSDSPQTPNSFYGIHAVSEDIIYIVDRASSDDTYNSILKFNYTKGNPDGCLDRFRIAFNTGIDLNNPSGVYVNDSQEGLWISEKTNDNPILYFIDISDCTNDGECYNDPNVYTVYGNDAESDYGYTALDSFDDGTTIYATEPTIGYLYKLQSDSPNLAYSSQNEYYLGGTTSNISGQSSNLVRSPYGLAMNNTEFWVTDTFSYPEVGKFRFDYPKDISIDVEGTNVYLYSGKLTSEINTNFNNTNLEIALTSNASLNLNFTAGEYGKYIFKNYFIKFNRTNSAVLSFITPEITHSTNGGDYTVNVTIQNSGNWNATQCTFKTVSSGTPNLNDNLAESSFSIGSQTNSTISVVFNNIQQSAEPDEKLQFYCENATDDSQTVYSDFIDVDITYIPSSPNQPGNGGSSSSIPQTQFDIVGFNALNEDTAQLSIRPASVKRDFCLDIINYATFTQRIYIECDLPTSQNRNVCSWIEFDRQYIDVLPSTEQRETFCMNITVPPDIAINDRYVVNIKGTVLSPASTKGTEDIHSVTMWVTNPILIFSDLQEQFNKNTISKTVYDFLTKTIKRDINEEFLNIPNLYNPLLFIMHLLMFLFVLLLFKKSTLLLHLVSQFITLIFTLSSLYQPLILLWMYFILLSLSFIIVFLRFVIKIGTST